MTETNSQRHEICLALGANIGDRLATLRAAKEALAPYVDITATSRVYETQPAYVTDQPLFLNAALRGTTTLDPHQLLFTIKDIEVELGRRPTFRYGPRAIDIDILIYDDLVLRDPDLNIPHALMQERVFVLAPLADISPAWKHPVLGKSVEEMLMVLPDRDLAITIGETF